MSITLPINKSELEALIRNLTGGTFPGDGDTIVFKKETGWRFGAAASDGEGEAGVSITGAHLDGFDLVLEFSDSTEVNVGDVRGPAGPADEVGISGAHLSGDDLVIEFTDASEVNVGSVRGATGATGADGAPGIDGDDGAPGADFWDQYIIASGDQSISSNTTETDDSELILPVLAGEVWMFAFNLVWTSASSTPAYKFRLACSAGTFHGYWKYEGIGASAFFNSAGIRFIGVANTTTVLGGIAAGEFPTLRIEGQIHFSNNCNFKLQWAQNTSNATAVTRKAGSLLRIKRLKV